MCTFACSFVWLCVGRHVYLLDSLSLLIQVFEYLSQMIAPSCSAKQSQSRGRLRVCCLIVGSWAVSFERSTWNLLVVPSGWLVLQDCFRLPDFWSTLAEWHFFLALQSKSGRHFFQCSTRMLESQMHYRSVVYGKQSFQARSIAMSTHPGRVNKQRHWFLNSPTRSTMKISLFTSAGTGCVCLKGSRKENCPERRDQKESNSEQYEKTRSKIYKMEINSAVE